MESYQPPIRAPGFPPGPWLTNYDAVPHDSWHGKVTLVDFFDFTCINCIRTLPYLRSWHARYEPLGLGVRGVHTPEFSFAHDPDVVKTGTTRLGVHWPVFLDKDSALWTAYANRYWPTLYLIDQDGKIRYRHVGEGNYAEIETRIQELLQEVNPQQAYPEILSPIRPEDVPGARCALTSPEMHIGSIDQVDIRKVEPKTYDTINIGEPDRIFLNGTWRVTRDGISLVGKVGEIMLRYNAASVYAVLSPYPDDRERLPFGINPLYIQLLQDGMPLNRNCFGEDILADGQNAHLRVDHPRLYNLVENPEVESHELTLKIMQPGLTFYAISFGTCLSRGDSIDTRSKE